MSTTICQVMGFIVSSLGVAGCIVSTSMDMWSTQDLYDNPVTAVFQYQGLWRSCVRQSSGFTECRPYFTILGLPGRDKKCSRFNPGALCSFHLKAGADNLKHFARNKISRLCGA